MPFIYYDIDGMASGVSFLTEATQSWYYGMFLIGPVIIALALLFLDKKVPYLIAGFATLAYGAWLLIIVNNLLDLSDSLPPIGPGIGLYLLIIGLTLWGFSLSASLKRRAARQ